MKRTYSNGKNKKIKFFKPFFISSIVGVLLLTGFYFIYSLNYQNHFLPNTEIYGIDISDKTVEQAAQILHLKLDQMNFKIIEKDQVLFSISSKELKLKKNYPELLNKLIKKQNPALWGVKTLAISESRKSNIENENLTVLLDQQSLQQFESKVKNELNQKRVAPKDAEIVLENGKYHLVKQIDGNTVNFTKLQKKIQSSIYNSNLKIYITEDDYQKPNIKDTDPNLKKQLNQIQTIQNTNIIYQIANVATIKIPSEIIISWIKYDGNSVKLNSQDIYNYLANINKNYSTVGITRKFKTSDGANIQLNGGTYGRQINLEADYQKIKTNLLSGKSGEIKATTIGQGIENNNPNDLGKTYVEVSKAKQHEWVYVNGKLFLQTDIVTGKPTNNNDTPTGTFVIWNKQKNQHLKGLNDDGTKYDSFVSYWIPIDYTGVGLHDSPWQPKYGGDWYKEHGSHGCINNPPEVIAKFFDILPIGTPVIIY